MSETSVRFAKKPDEPELCGRSRLEMFSDGAFAIIITLLVLGSLIKWRGGFLHATITPIRVHRTAHASFWASNCVSMDRIEFEDKNQSFCF